MDRETIDYLKAIGISKFELVEMVGCCESVNNVEFLSVVKVVETLEKYGCAGDDLRAVLTKNPKILCMTAEGLESALVTLGENATKKLLSDPFLI